MGNSGGGGFGMAPTTVTAGGTSFVLDPETGMMVPVGDNAQEDLVKLNFDDLLKLTLNLGYNRLFFWTFFNNDLQLRVGENLSFSKNFLSF